MKVEVRVYPREGILDPQGKAIAAALVRLVMGHSGIDRAVAEEGVESSTSTAIDAARILFPIRPIWRSPLDSATA